MHYEFEKQDDRWVMIPVNEPTVRIVRTIEFIDGRWINDPPLANLSRDDYNHDWRKEGF